MIVDTSAVVAYVRGEPDGSAVADLLVASGGHRMSAATRVELGLVLGAALDEDAIDAVLVALGIEVVPLTPTQARLASEAHRRFGPGRHPAALNLGDTCTYALAAEAGEPLVCLGNDFTRTDVVVAELHTPPSA